MSEGKPSPLLSDPRTKSRITSDAISINKCVPDLEVYDDGKAVYLNCKVECIGEVQYTYPETYPAKKFSITALDMSEGFNEELQRIVLGMLDANAADALIVALRLYLSKKKGALD